MRKKHMYYGVYGTNGCAITDSLEALMQITHYLRNEHYKGFDDFSEAEWWAVSGFAQSPRFPIGAYVPTPLRVNRAVFLKDLESVL